jgi:hypothetical protein
MEIRAAKIQIRMTSNINTTVAIRSINQFCCNLSCEYSIWSRQQSTGQTKQEFIIGNAGSRHGSKLIVQRTPIHPRNSVGSGIGAQNRLCVVPWQATIGISNNKWSQRIKSARKPRIDRA